MAVSIPLLDFYQALFERSCDAVNALAVALHNHYTQRGFVLLNKKVSALFRFLSFWGLIWNRGYLFKTHFVGGLVMQFNFMIFFKPNSIKAPNLCWSLLTPFCKTRNLHKRYLSLPPLTYHKAALAFSVLAFYNNGALLALVVSTLGGRFKSE